LRPPSHAAREIEDQLFGAGDAYRLDEITPPSPDGLVVVNLQETGIEEAARAAAARRHASGAGLEPVTPRPFGTVLHRGGARGIWAFRVRITDAEDEDLWETLLGVTHAARSRQRQRAGTSSAHFDMTSEQLLPLAAAHGAVLAQRVADTMQRPLTLAVRREQAILAALGARQARLAAPLIQPALFDRRVERAGTAQQEVFDDVIARCRAHLARLSRMQQPVAREPEPVFAVLLR
jgi:hypothetical protein